MKALLFINGEFPNVFPNVDGYDIIACSDGALNKLIKRNFPLPLLDFIAGDFDSHVGEHIGISKEKFIHTPDQSKTDFHKILEILEDKGAKEISIYGASGGEMDHFLGNLTTAHYFKNQLDLNFYDDYAHYFFSKKKQYLTNVKGKMISLYPFPTAQEVYSKGLHWELKGKDLSLIKEISTRNYADEDEVEISFNQGDLIIFVAQQYL